MALKTKYKHIHFKDASNELKFSKRKTKTYFCYNEAGQHLGTVQWYSPWRKYCFFPKYDRWTILVFSGGCLIDTGHFCEQLMEQRKLAKDRLEDKNGIEKYRQAVPSFMQGMLERGEIQQEKLDEWYKQYLEQLNTISED